MAKYVTVADNLGVSFRRSAALPIDDRSAVMNVDDLWKRSTWITETDSVVKLYAGIIVSAIGDGDQGTAGLYYLVADKSGSHRAAVALEYMWSDSDNVAPGAVSGTDVSAPGKSTTMGWRKLSFGDTFNLPNPPGEGDYILVVNSSGEPQWLDKRLVPEPVVGRDEDRILTVIDDGNGNLTYGWKDFWLTAPLTEGDYVLRRDANGNFTWVLSSSGSAEDTIGINIEGIYEDDGNGGIQLKSGASTTRKETLSNTGAVVAVEEGQAADGKFRLEIPIIDGGDALGDTGTIH